MTAFVLHSDSHKVITIGTNGFKIVTPGVAQISVFKEDIEIVGDIDTHIGQNQYRVNGTWYAFYVHVNGGNSHLILLGDNEGGMEVVTAIHNLVLGLYNQKCRNIDRLLGIS